VVPMRGNGHGQEASSLRETEGVRSAPSSARRVVRRSRGIQDGQGREPATGSSGWLLLILPGVKLVSSTGDFSGGRSLLPARANIRAEAVPISHGPTRRRLFGGRDASHGTEACRKLAKSASTTRRKALRLLTNSPALREGF